MGSDSSGVLSFGLGMRVSPARAMKPTRGRNVMPSAMLKATCRVTRARAGSRDRVSRWARMSAMKR